MDWLSLATALYQYETNKPQPLKPNTSLFNQVPRKEFNQWKEDFQKLFDNKDNLAIEEYRKAFWLLDNTDYALQLSQLYQKVKHLEYLAYISPPGWTRCQACEGGFIYAGDGSGFCIYCDGIGFIKNETINL